MSKTNAFQSILEEIQSKNIDFDTILDKILNLIFFFNVSFCPSCARSRLLVIA